MTTNTYLDYFQAFEVIKENYSKSLIMLQKIREYFLEFNKKVDTIYQSIQSTREAIVGLETKNVKIPSTAESPSYWLRLEETLNMSSIFHFMADDIKMALDKKLISFINEYKKEYEELLKKAEDNLKKQKESEEQAKAAHDRYMKLGNDVQTAFDNNEMDKIAKLREDFVRAQDAAVVTHKNLNGRTLLSCTLFEQTLSTYEKLERKRVDTVKSFYTELLNRISYISQFFEANAMSIKMTTKDFDPSNEAKLLKEKIYMKDSLCNQVFQPIHVSNRITKYLDIPRIFKDEISKGGKIVIATSDFNGNEDQLSVCKDEHLVTIEEQGEQYLCKNINDLVGLVPKSFLEFVE